VSLCSRIAKTDQCRAKNIGKGDALK
jgi:hypothetical protein